MSSQAERDIPGLHEGNRVVQESIERACEVLFHKKLSGTENLKAARELVRNKMNLIIVANHLSHADGPTLSGAISEAGFSDLRDTMVWLIGDRIARNPVTRIMSSSYPHISVSQVFDPEKDRNEAEGKKKRALSVIRVATKAIREVRSRGRVITVLPEGTRSRNSTLGEGVPQVAHYLEPEDYVLPIGLWGTEKVLPVDGFPRPGEVYVNFGEPFSVGSLMSEIGDLDGSNKDTRNRKIIEGVMTKIAGLLPEQYRGRYGPRLISPTTP